MAKGVGQRGSYRAGKWETGRKTAKEGGCR